MKILSYEYPEKQPGMIMITTDYAPNPVFVYRNDRFNNLAALEKEIDKKIQEITIREQRRNSKRVMLDADLKDAKVTKNA